jgi:hypothetical protein
MMNIQSRLLFALLTLGSSLFLIPATTRAGSYDLKSVKGIQAFTGSEEAKALLTKNGFVVADPTFKQIFEPYIKSPEFEQPSETNHWGVSLPCFITPDSAWDTYHVLLEEGVKEMETIQAQRLLKFSQALLSAARERHADNDLLLFASVGLAFQDEQHRQSLAADEKRIVDALRSGSGDVQAPIGFDLSPAQFRPQSFYTQSPQLSDYFAARQWYASVVFRLANARETKSAVALARLVNGNPQLLALWKQLSEPFDAFLAKAEDGGIPEYAAAAASLTSSEAISDAQLTEIQKKLEKQLPLPHVNDQMMSPEQFLHFANESRGFRMLPPRRLPCAQCFQDTVYPKIPDRYYPSGLDFLAASPVLRSPAAVRALQTEFGKNVSDAILKTDCGPMPDSLHGQAMELLAKLQQPLPSAVPAPLRTEAWQDLQLWTQLGAWAEQRHTWALHTKMNVELLGIVTPPKGMVAPYPDFFAGLATLTRRTAEAFQKAGLDQQFDVKTASDRLIDVFRSRKNTRVINMDDSSSQAQQFGQFEYRYLELHRAELEKNNGRDAYKQMQNDLEALAQRCSAGQPTPADIEVLRLFFDCRQDTVRLINDFAPVCDRLVELAKKSLHNEALTDDDAKWIEGYGTTLAGFHFYYGNSYEVPEDNFPIVTRVFYDPVGGKMFYAGLARPQALYVIIPNGKSQQLYRGAVMTYREFVHQDKELLDDESWRAMVAKGQAPPAPPFTKSFYAETSVAELLKQLQLRRASRSGYEEDENYRNPDEIFWQINARATEKDLPQLLEFFARAKGQENSYIADGIGEIIARLPWKSHEQQLMDLVASPDSDQANAATRIFIAHPEWVGSDAFAARFEKQPVRTRRLYCAIISQLPKQTDPTRQMLLRALHDPADGVRWQAALAIGKAGCNDESSRTALLETLNDGNELVAAAAVHALVKLGDTNAAPKFLEKLKAQVQLPVRVSEEWSPQAKAILGDIKGEENHALTILEVDSLPLRIEMGVTRIMQQRANFRGPPLPIDMPTHNYCLADELIEALGEFGYAPAIDELMKLRGTAYGAEAARALDNLAPDSLADGYLKTALDKQTDSYLREQALIALGKTSATNRVRELVPLLDDTTVINYSRPLPPGLEIKICDRAAETIAVMLGWEDRRMRRPFVPPKQREELMSRIRDWAKQPQ